MSSDILNFNDMWYTGDVPWHGFGISVPTLNALPDEAKAREYNKRAVAYLGDDNAWHVLDTHSAIYSPYYKQVMSVMGADYEIHSPEALFNGVFLPYMEAGQLEGRTMGFLGGGKRMWILAAVPGAVSDAGNGDKSELFMLLATSFDGTLGTMAKPTKTRVVCQNTMSVAMHDSMGKVFSQRHTSELKTDEARKQVENAISAFYTMAESEANMKSIKVTPNVVRAFVTELVQPELLALDWPKPMEKVPVLAKILDNSANEMAFEHAFVTKAKRSAKSIIEAVPTQLGGFDGSLYGAVNAVSYWTDHVKGRSFDTRQMSAFFGQGDQIKSKAFNLAESYAGILQAA